MSIGAGAIISLLGSLIGGAMKGTEKENTKSETRRWIQRAGQDIKGFTPKRDYYESGYLPTMDKIMHQAILGNLGKRLGSDTLSKWGIDLANIQQGINEQSPLGYGLGLSQPMDPSGQMQMTTPSAGVGGRSMGPGMRGPMMRQMGRFGNRMPTQPGYDPTMGTQPWDPQGNQPLY